MQTGSAPRKGRARRQAAPLPGALPVSRRRGSQEKRPEEERPMNIPSLATTLHRVFSSFSRTEPQVNTIPDKADDMSVSQDFTAGSAQAEG